MSILYCDHCGDIAIEQEEFSDGDGGACFSCGFPGHVSIDDSTEDVDCYWLMLDDDPGAVCNRVGCEECVEFLHGDGS